jgi:hypothetical protein
VYNGRIVDYVYWNVHDSEPRWYDVE